MSLITRFEAGHEPDSDLFVLVHGKAGHIDIMRIFLRSLPEGAHKLFVQAPEPDKRGGFSWWDTDQESFPVEKFQISQKLLTTAVEDTIIGNQLTPNSIHGLGFSQGSAMLSSLILSGALRLNSLAILAGFVKWPEKIVRNLKTKVFWGHGTEDDVILFSRAQSDVEKLQKLGLPVTFVSDPVGHKLGSKSMRELKSFFLSE